MNILLIGTLLITVIAGFLICMSNSGKNEDNYNNEETIIMIAIACILGLIAINMYI